MADAGDTTPEAGDALEIAVAEAIEACDGDARAAVRALLVALEVMDRDVAALEAEVERITATVSGGYVRGKLRPTTG